MTMKESLVRKGLMEEFDFVLEDAISLVDDNDDDDDDEDCGLESTPFDAVFGFFPIGM